MMLGEREEICPVARNGVEFVVSDQDREIPSAVTQNRPMMVT
jgi:hypothetical protein